MRSVAVHENDLAVYTSTERLVGPSKAPGMRRVYRLVSIISLARHYFERISPSSGLRMSNLILREGRGAVAFLSFDRLKKLNARGYALIDELMRNTLIELAWDSERPEAAAKQLNVW